jgi:1,2-diacylglycerol 3-beta-galactosyltransferase
MKKKIVLLYGDTGGGHRSAALSIQQGLRLLYSDTLNVQLANGLMKVPPFLSAFTDTYPMWVNHARMLYALGFHATNNRRRIIALRSMLEPLSEKTADSIVENNPADVYVSVHPLFGQGIPAALKRLAKTTPFIHVVTDLVTGHAAHYVTDADHIIVPTAESRREALRNFVPRRKISVTGQPVSPDFAKRLGLRDEVRRQLNLDDDLLTVLLIGGGDGMGRLEITARHLALSNLPVQLLVVCGRNQTVKENLEFINPRVPMKVMGFVNNIPELMGASDVLITKAGPGTISEAFIAGLPIILYDAVPGQEEGNVDFVVDSGAGAWCPTPWSLERTLKNWIANPQQLARARKASIALARPDSAVEIARIIGRFAQKEALQQESR